LKKEELAEFSQMPTGHKANVIKKKKKRGLSEYSMARKLLQKKKYWTLTLKQNIV
jgi:site-specific recombinase XerC